MTTQRKKATKFWLLKSPWNLLHCLTMHAGNISINYFLTNFSSPLRHQNYPSTHHNRSSIIFHPTLHFSFIEKFLLIFLKILSSDELRNILKPPSSADVRLAAFHQLDEIFKLNFWNSWDGFEEGRFVEFLNWSFWDRKCQNYLSWMSILT